MSRPRIPRQHDDEAEARERALAALLALGENLERNGRSSTSPPPGDGTDTEALRRAIEGELIPRLMLAHAPPRRGPEPSDASPAHVTSEDRARIVDAVVAASPTAGRRLVEEVLARGVPREELFLDLLAHAARRLGELWEADRADFSTVTIGLCRLHGLLRDQGFPADACEAGAGAAAPSILLANAPGDQHVFGVVMVSEFFRKAGWQVVAEAGATPPRLKRLVAEQSFDLLGLSAACTTLVRDVRREIEVLRRASRNEALRVIVGGGLFVGDPALVREVGADVGAFDARSAPDAAKSLLTGTVARR